MSSSLTTAQANPAEQYLPDFVDRWDQLIDWDKRRAGEDGFFPRQLTGARRVLDAAAGTGYHSVTLADAGFEVTAIDISEEMVAQTKRNAELRGHQIHARQADWRELGTKIDGTFDAVVCLGSSFPHLFDEADRIEVLREFRDKLEPGGKLIIDHRNFDAILAQRFSGSGKYYYCGSAATVEVDHADARLCRFRYTFADGATYRLEVYPIRQAELRDLLWTSGFTDIRSYGDFQSDYHPLSPDFVIHTAVKS